MKTRDVSSAEKIATFLEELRMPSLLVQPFPIQIANSQYIQFYWCSADEDIQQGGALSHLPVYSMVRTAVLYTKLRYGRSHV